MNECESAAPGPPSLPPGFSLITYETVGSTNDEAKMLARSGAADGTVVLARRQTAGRGRRGRQWESAEGNLCASVVLRPEHQARNAAELSFVAAVAATLTVAGVLPPTAEVTAKWPNDILVQGRKVCGILLESEPGIGTGLEWVVLGVGLNVAHHPIGLEYPATSLVAEGAHGLDPAFVLKEFCAHFGRWRERWRVDGFQPVRSAWLARGYGLGQPITVRLADRVFRGIFRDIDNDGALLLEESSTPTVRRITAGDVFLAPPNVET